MTDDYTVTSIWIRKDLKSFCSLNKINKREVLEKALLEMIKPEDLAYIEAQRLEKELESKKKRLEELDTGGVTI